MAEYTHVEIAALYEKWTLEERNRIIKLLEEHPPVENIGVVSCGKCWTLFYDEHLLALIKEGKE